MKPPPDRLTVALAASLADLRTLAEEIPDLLTRNADERTHAHARLLLTVRHAVEELRQAEADLRR